MSGTHRSPRKSRTAMLLAVPTTLNVPNARCRPDRPSPRRSAPSPPVVLVVHVLELERERAVADVHATLGIDLLEVGLPAAGDLRERLGQAGLRIARRQLDDVALDLLAWDRWRSPRCRSTADRPPSRRSRLRRCHRRRGAAGRTHQGQREQRREPPRFRSPSSCEPPGLMLSLGTSLADAGGTPADPADRRPRRASRRRTPPTSPSGNTYTMAMRAAPKIAGARISLPSIRSSVLRRSNTSRKAPTAGPGWWRRRRSPWPPGTRSNAGGRGWGWWRRRSGRSSPTASRPRRRRRALAKVPTLVPARFTPTVVAAISWSRTATIARPCGPGPGSRPARTARP